KPLDIVDRTTAKLVDRIDGVRAHQLRNVGPLDVLGAWLPGNVCHPGRFYAGARVRRANETGPAREVAAMEQRPLSSNRRGAPVDRTVRRRNALSSTRPPNRGPALRAGPRQTVFGSTQWTRSRSVSR